MQFKKVLDVAFALVSRAAGTALQFILNVLLGRILGSGGLGNFYIFISWTNIFGTINSLGLPLYILKNVSRYYNEKDKVRFYVIKSLKIVFFISFISLLLFFLLYGLISDVWSLKTLEIIKYSIVAGGLLALLRVFADTFKAIKHYNIGLSIEFSAIPLLLLITIGLLYLCGLNLKDINQVLYLYIFISLLVVFISSLIFYFVIGIKNNEVFNRDYNEPIKIKQLLAFLGILLINNVLASIPYLVLPFYATSSEIGEFGVAHRLISLSGTILMALAAYFTPLFSKSRDEKELKKLYRQSQFFSLISYLPLFLAYVIFPEEIISVFGNSFSNAKYLLIILAFGRLINASIGLCEQYLSMSGKENIELLNGICTIILFLILSIILGNKSGVIGITWAYAIAFIYRALFSYFIIYKVRILSLFRLIKTKLAD